MKSGVDVFLRSRNVSYKNRVLADAAVLTAAATFAIKRADEKHLVQVFFLHRE